MLNIRSELEIGLTSDVTLLALLFFQSFMHTLEPNSLRQNLWNQYLAWKTFIMYKKVKPTGYSMV